MRTIPRCARKLLLGAVQCCIMAACSESPPTTPSIQMATPSDGAVAQPSDAGSEGASLRDATSTTPAGNGADAGFPPVGVPGMLGGLATGDAGPGGEKPSMAGDEAGAGAATADAATADDAGLGDSGTSPAVPCTGTPLSPGDHEYPIESKNGQKYSYILSVPESVDPTQRAPVIVHWHALSSDPEEARKVTDIDAQGEAAKALLVFPRSPDKSWDVGTCCTSTVGGVSRDEEVFARELIKDVVSKACVDERRIYTNGFSNGGMISQMLACKMADVFAAATPLGSTLTIPPDECQPSRPIPIFMLNGTADPLVGYDSSGLSGGLSVPEDVQFWADKNGCTGEPEMYLSKGKVTCRRYTQCSAGVEVAHCAVEGMGHCVPGMKTESASNCMTKTAFGLLPIQLGMPNDDIDALQMDVEFLLRFTLPKN